MKLGATLRTSNGLRWVPLDAAALGIDFAVIDIPRFLDEDAAQEFRVRTLGLDVVVRCPLLNPMEPWEKLRQEWAKAFHAHLKIAVMLRARALIVSTGQWPGHGWDAAMAARHRASQFFDYESEFDLPVWLMQSEQKFGRETAAFIARDACAAGHNFGIVVNPSHQPSLWWDREQFGPFMETHGNYVKAFWLQTPRDNPLQEVCQSWHTGHLVPKLFVRPIIIDDPSLAVQNDSVVLLEKIRDTNRAEGVL